VAKRVRDYGYEKDFFEGSKTLYILKDVNDFDVLLKLLEPKTGEMILDKVWGWSLILANRSIGYKSDRH